MLRVLYVLVATFALAGTAGAAPALGLDLPEGPAETQLCHKGEKDDVCAVVAQHNLLLAQLMYLAVETACRADPAKVCNIA